MKQLAVGVILLVLVGIAGFFYRNTLERPGPVIACPLDAKICPDGSSVGRTGPACAFAACPTPATGVAYDIPAGYTSDENAYGADPSLLDAFVKPSLAGDPPHTIIVHQYAIDEGQTANDVILAHTRFEPSDMQAESMEKFTAVTIGSNTFQSVVIERFEGQVHSAYFLALPTSVVMFEIIEHDVANWSDANLVIKNLPEHKVFLQMLASVRTR